MFQGLRKLEEVCTVELYVNGQSGKKEREWRQESSSLCNCCQSKNMEFFFGPDPRFGAQKQAAQKKAGEPQTIRNH